MRLDNLIERLGLFGRRMTRLAIAGTVLSGCNAYRLEPPIGFAQVDRDESRVRMKGPDDVGLNLRVYDNVRGGTLAYWSEDLVRKLSKRGYALQSQIAVTSDNGVAGTRFDFAYQPEGADSPKFFTAILFVSDRYKVIVQLAGDAEQHARLAEQIDQIAADTKVRGCRLGKRTCKGPQPPALSPAASQEAATARNDAREPADG